MKTTERYDEYLAGLLRGDRAACTRIVQDLLAAGVPLKTLYTDLLGAALYQVGELWQSNRISVATEHLATAVTQSVMNDAATQTLFNHEPAGRSLIVSCLTNEYHQVGGRMVADIAELKGWDTSFLGANTPLPDLLSFIDEKRPDVLALSAAFYTNLPNLRAAIEAVRGRYPLLPIWLGGQAFRWGGQELETEYPHVRVFHTLADFETALEQAAAK